MNELTAVQLAEWEAYDKLDPVGSWREDFRMAYICTIITNSVISVHGKQGAALKNIDDFMPKWDNVEPEGQKKQTVEEMKNLLLSIAKVHNKQFENKRMPNMSNIPKTKGL